MLQSKLKSFEKKMYHGNHETYTNEHGKYWKFTVTFDNGDIGVAMSKKESSSWNAGIEYTYEKSVNGDFTNIKDMKKVEGSSSYNKGGDSTYQNYYDKPEVQKAINLQYSMDASLKYCSKKLELEPERVITKDIQEKLRDAIYKWVVSMSEDIKEYINIRAAMNSAIDNIIYFKIANSTMLFEKAADIYNKLKALRDEQI
jgi:hypothetical protein